MALWDIVLGPVLDIIKKVVPDKAAQAAAEAALKEQMAQGALQEELMQLTSMTTAQSDINKVEAASPKLFVSGWRPYIGWVCGAALSLAYVVGPMFTWVTALCGHSVPFPAFDLNTLMPLMFGMLGMGSLRTFEKIKNVAAK